MPTFTLNETFDVNKEWNNFLIQDYDDKDGWFSDNIIRFELHADILAISYGYCPDKISYPAIHVVIAGDSSDNEFVYFFDNSLVNEAGWYHLENESFIALETSAFPIFEGCTVDASSVNNDEEVLEGNLEIVNTYFGDVFKFVN